MIAPSLPPPRLISRRAPDAGAADVVCALSVRNERLRLPDFLRHHRERGVAEFLAIDDRSTDGTREYLLEQPDVSVFEIDAEFSASRGGALWKNAILDRYAMGRWALPIDVDELLVYPHHDRVGLPEFCRWLDARGADCTTATMVDMYPRDLDEVRGFAAGDSMLAACPSFDRDGYRAGRRRAFPHRYLRGGPRARLFYDRDPPAWARLYMEAWRALEPFGLQRALPRVDVTPWEPPFLTKVALVRWRAGMRFVASTHLLAPALREAAVSTALLHFKFLGDFAEQVARAVAAKNYWRGSIEYRRYAEKLAKDPAFGFHGPSTALYRGPDDLVAAGLMRDPPDFAAWAAAQPVRAAAGGAAGGAPLTRGAAGPA